MAEHDVWELDSFAIGRIGDLLTSDRFGWVLVNVTLQLKSYDVHPGIHIEVPVQYERAWTIDKVREAAFAQARDILSRTNDLLARHSLAELQQQDDDLRRKEVPPVLDFETQE